jgi:hypothetical protein
MNISLGLCELILSWLYVIVVLIHPSSQLGGSCAMDPCFGYSVEWLNLFKLSAGDSFSVFSYLTIIGLL